MSVHVIFSDDELALLVFTFPIFMLSYVPISVAALFKKVEWVPTKHDIAVNFEDVVGNS